MLITSSLSKRFDAKVHPEPNTGCFLWAAATHSTLRYGIFGVGGTKVIRAHRFAWIREHGPIPPGLFVCHHCDVPWCVNVDHLFLGTAKDNSLDMIAKGRGRNQNTSKTHCDRGHEFTEENTVPKTRPGDGRSCRTCRSYTRREKRRAEGTAEAGKAKRRARAAAITHCPAGHPYDEANTGIANRCRYCRACHRDRSRQRRELQRRG